VDALRFIHPTPVITATIMMVNVVLAAEKNVPNKRFSYGLNRGTRGWGAFPNYLA